MDMSGIGFQLRNRSRSLVTFPNASPSIKNNLRCSHNRFWHLRLLATFLSLLHCLLRTLSSKKIRLFCLLSYDIYSHLRPRSLNGILFLLWGCLTDTYSSFGQSYCTYNIRLCFPTAGKRSHSTCRPVGRIYSSGIQTYGFLYRHSLINIIRIYTHVVSYFYKVSMDAILRAGSHRFDRQIVWRSPRTSTLPYPF